MLESIDFNPAEELIERMLFKGIDSYEEEYEEDIETFNKPMQGTITRVAPKTGRNDPCPCGSGKKFKKCCGAK